VQLAFPDALALPWFELVESRFPALAPLAKRVRANRQCWEDLAAMTRISRPCGIGRPHSDYTTNVQCYVKKSRPAARPLQRRPACSHCALTPRRSTLHGVLRAPASSG
jgi:hypothetical protein